MGYIKNGIWHTVCLLQSVNYKNIYSKTTWGLWQKRVQKNNLLGYLDMGLIGFANPIQDQKF